MKKTFILALSLLLISCLLCGCFPQIMFIPDKESIGESKKFEKVGLTITLTDKFKEEQSQRGFDAYYTSSFCGVVVLKEEFTLKEGMAEESLEEYITSVIKNNGNENITPQTKDGLWFYEKTSDYRYVRSYSYKGSDAFYIVQFICNLPDVNMLEDTFHLWAASVTVE